MAAAHLPSISSEWNIIIFPQIYRMKLKSLVEGHWQIIGNHPGYPKKKKRKKRELSFFVNPPKINIVKMK